MFKKLSLFVVFLYLSFGALAGSTPPAYVSAVVHDSESRNSNPCFVEIVTTADHAFINTRYVEKITVTSTNLNISMARTRDVISYPSNAAALEAAKRLIQKIQTCKVS